MRRIFAIVAIAAIFVVAISVTIWLSSRTAEITLPPTESSAPRQFDTTGGQEMRPRWNNSGGQQDDVTGN